MLRKRFIPHTLGILALLISTGLAVGAPAQAAPARDGKAPIAVLVLSVSEGEHPRPDAKRTLLTCEPTGGAHPLAEAACQELAAVGGDIAAVEIEPNRPCYLIYQPVTVTARGLWNGKPISYRETFPNDCVLDVIKGPIFRF